MLDQQRGFRTYYVVFRQGGGEKHRVLVERKFPGCSPATKSTRWDPAVDDTIFMENCMVPKENRCCKRNRRRGHIVASTYLKAGRFTLGAFGGCAGEACADDGF